MTKTSRRLDADSKGINLVGGGSLCKPGRGHKRENSTKGHVPSRAKLVNSKVMTISEAAALGGKNRSPKKVAAAMRNLERAQAAKNAKRSRTKEHSTLA
jgi:hypothetical protein